MRASGPRGRPERQFQRIQLTLAPDDSTRAARLDMARKILFDMLCTSIEVDPDRMPPLVGSRMGSAPLDALSSPTGTCTWCVLRVVLVVPWDDRSRPGSGQCCS
jgi:hypothetical protein